MLTASFSSSEVSLHIDVKNGNWNLEDLVNAISFSVCISQAVTVVMGMYI